MADVGDVSTLGRFFCDGRVIVSQRGEFESFLQGLVEVARSGDGRRNLGLAGAVPALVSFSSCVFPSDVRDFSESWWSFESFYLYVKLLRNLCAGEAVNQEALVGSAGGLEAVARVVEVLVAEHGTCEEEGESAVPGEGLQIVLQLLGNVAGLGEVSRGKIWERFFPSVLEIVARVADQKVRGPLCMLVYTCCKDNDSRCSELVEDKKGAFVVASILLNGGEGKGDGNAEPNEWLEFLLTRLCFGNPGLPAVFSSLGDAETNGFTKEQASLLDVLNASLRAREEENHHTNDSDSSSAEASHYTCSMPLATASFFIDVIRAAAKNAALSNLSVLQLPTKSPVADVLGLSLSMTRILCVLDANRSSVIPKFVSSGLIPLLLSLLRALGPPDNAKASPTSSQDLDEQPSSSSGDDSERFPRRDVYTGYRRDVLAVIANASHRSLVVQELVRENGGLLVVLQQCMPDSNNPFLREWGLWAIRNLLEGNSANQTELADLEIKSTVPDSRLKEAGMSVEINPETGRPRLVNVAPGTDNPAADEFM